MHSGLPFDDECARTYLNTNRRWGQGPWSQYASAIIWSIGAMSGEAYLPANMEETVRSRRPVRCLHDDRGHLTSMRVVSFFDVETFAPHR